MERPALNASGTILGLILNKKEKVNSAPVFISPCLLAVNSI